MVNGIVGFGCRAFYGVKAVRFVMASNSQLKYGARLINAYLGDNATISCCEVLNSLIFPAHEQHHNNSFLCAAVVMGQSNMAAGATIGSNHNSRANDGELIAKRGFWPGLCVSLKHNSRFASFTIIAKGDYPAELDIPLPFSLVSQEESKNVLQIMPAYWFMYNMYALARNAWKYKARDKRPDKIQHLEFNYLAPDTANEMAAALELLEKYAGQAVAQATESIILNENALRKAGREYLEGNGPEMEIVAHDMENATRKTIILKAREAYQTYKKFLRFYCITECADYLLRNIEESESGLPAAFTQRQKTSEWLNVGGQLFTAKDLNILIDSITKGKIKNWEEVHNWYTAEGAAYADKKAFHAMAMLKTVHAKSISSLTTEDWKELMEEALATRKWISENVYQSRKKDYSNKFKLMMYDSEAEMEKVLGKLDDNEFILQEKEELKEFQKKMKRLKKQLFK
jgi:hypothetical protein